VHHPSSVILGKAEKQFRAKHAKNATEINHYQALAFNQIGLVLPLLIFLNLFAPLREFFQDSGF
jgi:hypothetical protein